MAGTVSLDSIVDRMVASFCAVQLNEVSLRKSTALVGEKVGSLVGGEAYELSNMHSPMFEDCVHAVKKAIVLSLRNDHG